MNTKQIIKSLGGVAATAKLCEVTMSAVSQWEENGIPHARLMFLKLARPEAFDELEFSQELATSDPAEEKNAA